MLFKELDDLIKSGEKEITLNENVILGADEDEMCFKGIEIKRDGLVIDGKNHIIDGNNMASIMSINASNVTLKNIIFKNGFSEDFSGALNNYANDLIIDHCQFINNCAECIGNRCGGAIYNAPDSSLFIRKSIFMENDSEFGGAILIDSDSILELSNSVFESNTVEYEGGAIYNKGELIISGSMFNRNAAFKGGAIYNENILKIDDSKFIANIASEGNDIKTENQELLSISNSLCQFIE